jgi:hypothetical protein
MGDYGHASSVDRTWSARTALQAAYQGRAAICIAFRSRQLVRFRRDGFDPADSPTNGLQQLRPAAAKRLPED